MGRPAGAGARCAAPGHRRAVQRRLRGPDRGVLQAPGGAQGVSGNGGDEPGAVALAVSLGDPGGVGPEVVAAAIADGRASAAGIHMIVCGDGGTLARAADLTGTRAALEAALGAGRVRIDAGPDAGAARAGSGAIAARRGALSLGWVERGIELVKGGAAAGLVTGPISKAHWHAAGAAWPGHTELLAERFASPESGMVFVGPRLRVALATVHVPLERVAGQLTLDAVTRAIRLAHWACRAEGVERPRVAVAGLNPHAGEGGLLGSDEARVIGPAVAQARGEGIAAVGPVSGDAVFGQALAGAHDAVVAMYHDQGLIPVKLIDGRLAVNVTAGLRWAGRAVVRASPAHGTAEDIAWTGRADARSMIEALLVAARLARRTAV
ncbi:MAG: 4-hydroxythreonine-4-phosphate dehydrogenase PdxA [Planctomyces sp.]|nr:4-hydroxythreonine-4-phosphate dehydrogenase PdxA [Planctomyces sp.]MBA4039240.1 4-hydroxythreonine-4-phosphate dehydrogenase PdxA [Planctomyces sp.]